MKKIFQTVILSVLVLIGLNANAQYDKGDNLLNVGLNVGGTLGGGVGVGASYEVGIHDYISVGGEADFVSYGTLGYKWNFISFGGRGSYHFGKLFIENDKLDLYGGLNLGFRLASWNGVGSGTYGNGMYFGPHIGGRYYFKPNIAVLAETGWTAAALKVGLTFKM